MKKKFDTSKVFMKDSLNLFEEKIDKLLPHYKVNSVLKNINIENKYRYKINNNATYIGNILLEINIPYFNLKRNTVINTQNVTENLIYSTLLYNNFKTYLIKSESKYYLIPSFNFNITFYKLDKLKFVEIKQYMSSRINKLINDTEDIYFLQVNNSSNLIQSNIFNLLFQYANFTDKHNLNYILKNNNDIFLKNLITTNTYNNYLVNLKNEIIYNRYAYNYRISNSLEYYQITFDNLNEFNYYNTLITKKPALTELITTNLDVVFNYRYFYNDTNINSILSDVMIDTSYIILFILKNYFIDLNFIFYKKYSLIDNKVDNTISINNYSISDNWDTNYDLNLNIKSSLKNLHLPLILEFKKLYFNNNIFTQNLMKNLNLDNPILTWKKLKTIDIRFSEIIGYDNNININYQTYEQYLNELSSTNLMYMTTNTLSSVDLFNIYVVILEEFLDRIIALDIFYDVTFIKIFKNKFVNYLYLRYHRVNTFSDTSYLTFYYKLNLDYVMIKEYLSNELKNIFYNRSFIGIIPERNILTELTLTSTLFQNVPETSGLSDNSILNNFNDLKIISEYNILQTEFQLENDSSTVIYFNKDKVNYRNSTYFIKNSNINILDFYIIDDLIYFKLSDTIENDFTLIEENYLKIPLIKTDVTGDLINSIVRYTLYDNLTNNFITNNEFNTPITDYNSNDITYINYIKDGINYRYKVDLTTNNTTYRINIDRKYLDYDTVYLEYYKLPITSVAINDSYCYDVLLSTIGATDIIKKYYPKIYLDVTNTSLDTTLFTELNTIMCNKKKVRFVQQTSSYIELHIDDNNEFIGNTLSLEVFKNSYLPNLYSFTSLGSVNDIMDYFIQQPLLIKLTTGDRLPIYLFENIPWYNSTTVYYLNNLEINTIYNTNSNQIIRNTTLYSSHFDRINTKINSDNKFDTTDFIYKKVKKEFSDILNIQEYSSITNLLDNVQKNYINSYKEYFLKIKTGIFGDTVATLLNNLNKLDENFSLTEYNFNFNEYTNFAIGLYTFNNLIFDTTLNDSVTINTKDINFLQNQTIFNSPYLRYSNKFNLSDIVINYLEIYSKYLQNQSNFYTNINNYNLIIDKNVLDNNYNSIQEINNSYNTLYLENNGTHINLLNDSKYRLNPNIKLYYDNREINYDNTNGTTSINEIYTLNYTQKYDENIILNNSLNSRHYNLIGSVKVINNKIIYNDSSKSILSNLVYFVDDENSVHNINKNISKIKGINYNSKKLTILSMFNISLSNTDNNIFVYRLSITNDTLSENTNYYIEINNIFGCARLENNILIIILNNYVNIKSRFKFNYISTSDSITNILSNVINNIDNNTFTLNFIITSYTILDARIINYYYTSTFNSTNFILTSNTNILNYKYNSFIKYNTITLFYIDQKNITSVDVNNVDEILLPPVLPKNNKIQIYNLTDNYNIFEDNDHWLKINGNEFKVKNINIQSIPDNNYLIYYCPSKIQPQIIQNENYVNNINSLENITLLTFTDNNILQTNATISDDLTNFNIVIDNIVYEILSYSGNTINLKTPNNLSDLFSINDSISNYYFVNNKVLSINEINLNNSVSIINNYEINITNEWELISTFEIHNKTIIDNTNILKEYKYFIFNKDDEIYFNETALTLDENKILKYDYNFSSVDIFGYNREPYFIKTDVLIDFSLSTNNSIFIKANSIEIYQLIMIDNIPIYIYDYSTIELSFVGKILLQKCKITSNSYTGYYNFGILSNLNYRYNLLNNSNNNFSFKKSDKSELVSGDYYIDTNNLKIYEVTDNPSDIIFKLNKGVYFSIYYFKDLDKYYYDKTKIKLNINDVIYVEYNSVNYILRVKTLDNNFIEFFSIDISLSTNTKLSSYSPYQPFITKNISILNNKVTENINGWLEIKQTSNTWVIINVVNSILQSTITDGTYTCRLIDNKDMFVNSDFRHNLNISDNNNIDNKSISWKFRSKILNEGTRIYINYPTGKYIFRYNQNIIINDYKYLIKNVTADKIFINRTTADIEFNLNSEYDVIISCDIINDLKVVSNNKILYSNKIVDYPTIQTGTYDLLIIKIDTGNSNYTMLNKSVELNLTNNTINITLNEYNTSYKYYINNYIPITITHDTTKNIFTFTQTNIELEVDKYYLLEEKDSYDRKFIHLIKLQLVNGFFKLADSNFFIDKKSTFYLHTILPVKIINGYVQLLYPKIKFYNFIIPNNIKTLEYFLSIPIDIISQPISSDNKWKYIISITDDNFSIINRETLYLDFSLNLEGVIKFENSKYYLYVDELLSTLLSHVIVKKKNIISSLKKNIKFREEYDVLNNNSVRILNNNLFGESSNDIYYTNKIKIISNTDNSYNIQGYNLDITQKYNMFFINQPIQYLTETGNNNYYLLGKNKIYNLTVNNSYNLYQKIIEKTDYTINENISSSIEDIQNIFTSLPVKSNFITKLKPWDEWSLYIDLTGMIKGSIIYNNSIFSYDNDSSYFSLDQIKYIQSYLKFLETNTDYINIMTELKSLEIYLFNRVLNLITESYFWNNIDTILLDIVESYDGTNKWTIYNNCLMINNNNILECETNKDLFTGNSVIDRIIYLPSEFVVTFISNTFKVSRDTTVIQKELDNILSNEITNNGISFNQLYRELLIIQEERNNYNKNVLYQNDMNNSYIYMINNIWHKIKNNSNFININKKFNSSLSLIYDKIQKYSKYFTKDFNEVYYNSDSITKGNIYKLKNSITTLKHNEIYKYKLSSTNTKFKDDIIYKIDILEGKFKLIDPIITEYITEPDSLIFSTNIENINDISLQATEIYQVMTTINYGKIYSVTLNKSVINSNVTFYYNNVLLQLIKNTSSTVKELASNNELLSSTVIKAELKINLLKVNIQNNKTYINVSSEFDIFYETDNIFLNYSNNLYEIKQDSDGYYINKSILLRSNILYSVCKYISITESIDTLLYYYNLKLESPLESTNLQINSTSNNNFSIDNFDINETIIYNLTNLKIKSTTNLENITEIKFTYNINESNDYTVSSLTDQMKYLYRLNGNFNLKSGVTVEIVKDNTIIPFTLFENNTTHIILESNIHYEQSYFDGTTFIKKYIYTIPLGSYTLNSNILIASINNNFDLNHNIYTYTLFINGLEVSFTFSIENNKFKFILSEEYSNSINSINLHQIKKYSINNLVLSIPDNNAIFRLVSNTEMDISKNYIPLLKYTNINKEYSDNIYKFSYIHSDSNTIDFGNNLYIYNSQSIILVNIVDIYIIDNAYTLIIDAGIELDLTHSYEFNSYDMLYTSSITILKYNNGYDKGIIYDIIDNKNVDLLLNYNKFSNYTDNSSYSSLNISFKYQDFIVENISYKNNNFFKNSDIITNITKTEIETVAPKFVDDVQYKLFEYIEFNINDYTIEKLNSHVYKIFKSYYKDFQYNTSFKELISLTKNTDKSISFKLPLIFFFNFYNNFLPICALNRSKVFIEFKLNSVDKLISNLKEYPILDNQFNIRMNIIQENYYLPEIYNNMLVNTEMHKVINTFTIYAEQLVNKDNIRIKLNNVVRDIFWFIDNQDTNTINYDFWYTDFKNNHDIYLDYINNDIFDENNVDNISIFIKIEKEISDAENNINISTRFNVCDKNLILKNFSKLFLFYLDEKYLSYIGTDWSTVGLNKVYILTYYLQKIYSVNNISRKNNIIKNINIELDGVQLSPITDIEVYNLAKSGYGLDNNYYHYTFNFDSTSEQPNGHLNFENITNLTFLLEKNFVKNDTSLNFISRDYKVLKFYKGIGGII
uniref:Uncharacterized protein n=1 Tax=Megaviridae environmental sample TaxID=1737588 RepID=A0A5J6VMB2_9VIRU|nr:MAG: hypothetical protein [Megaviridae environmental sample]